MLGPAIVCAIAILTILAIGWLMTCGIVYLISLCFGFAFTWAIGSGVWLVLLLLGGLFGKGK